MDPKKNKPKTGSQPMNVDPNMAARMGNLPAGGRKNIRVRKLSDEEKAQSRQSKIKGGLEDLTGRSFGGGEPTAGGDVDPKTGNLLPNDPRRSKKKRNVSGPAGPGDIDPETGDLIGEGAPEPSSGNPYKFNTIADLKKKLADINARGREQERRKAAENNPLRSLDLPAQGTKSRMIQPENKNESVLHERTVAQGARRINPAVKAEMEKIEARRRERIPQRDAMAAKYGMDTSGIDAEKAKEFNPDGTLNPSYTPPPPSTSLPKGASGMGSNRAFGAERLRYARERSADRAAGGVAAAETKKRNIMTTSGSGLSRETAAGNQAMYDRKDTADANLKRLEAGRKSLGQLTSDITKTRKQSEPQRLQSLGRSLSTAGRAIGGAIGTTLKSTGGELQASSARRLGEGVKKAGHPESFELGLDAETTENPEYQKILRQKRVERAKQMLNPKLARTMGDDVSQDDIEAADRAARRRKRVDEAMGKRKKQLKYEDLPAPVYGKEAY